MSAVSCEERFWARVAPGPDDCWLWTANIKWNGYGDARGRIAGRHVNGAHRVAYELLRAEIPAGLDLDHLCRVRNCVNPWHLEPVTRSVNINRGNGPSGINARKTHCNEGHSLSGDNLRMDRGHRHCRTCDRRRDQARPSRAVPRTPSTHCKNGHLLAGDNLRPNARGIRICRTCARDWGRERARVKSGWYLRHPDGERIP